MATDFSLAKLTAEAQMGQEVLIRNAWDKSSLSTFSAPHLQDKSASVNHSRVSPSVSVSHRQHPGGSSFTLRLT